MTDREKLIREKLIELLRYGMDKYFLLKFEAEILADLLIANGVTVRKCPRPLEEWGEDHGDVLWWKFPIEEPPYVGSPLDEKWPNYHTHWTPIVVPEPPKEE